MTSKRSKVSSIAFVAIVTLVAMVGFLFSPRVPHGQEDANCVSVTDVGPMHFHKNCDSEEFQYIAAHPGLILSERPGRQSRPLFALLGWAFARPFRIFGVQAIGHKILAGANQTYPKGPSPAEYFPEYAGFVTLNWVLLVGAVLVFLKLADARGVFDPLTLLPLTMIVINQVTKAAFWTPHLQIFNVAVPLGSIALYQWMIRRDRRLDWVHVAMLGIAIGVGALTYGAFAVMAAGAALCVFLGHGKRSWRESISKRFAKSALLLVVFLIPAATWTAFVIHRTGSFYSSEINLNRQFVWMADSVRAGGLTSFFRDLASQSQGYFDTLMTTVPVPLLVAVVLAMFLKAFNKVRETIIGDWTLILGITLYAIANILFFWLLGTYESRLTWSVVPAIAVLIAVEMHALDRMLSARGKLVVRSASIAATVLYAAYWYTIPGPWS